MCACFTSEHLQGFGGVCFYVLCVFVSHVNTCKDLVAFVFLFSVFVCFTSKHLQGFGGVCFYVLCVFVSHVNTCKDLVAFVFLFCVCLFHK